VHTITRLILFALLSPSLWAAEPNAYAVRHLVSDGSVPADNTDTNLIDGWGVAFNPNGVVWVNSAGAGKSVLYDGNGVPQSLVVTVPAGASGGQGIPTGITFSSSNDFVVRKGTLAGPSRFIFASLTGSISGWAPNVDVTNALVAVDRSGEGASYTGLALAANGSGNLLYAADVRRGRIDVFDRTFAPATLAGGFVDPHLPAGFVPFAIHNLQGNLYVSFGRLNPAGNFVQTGRGLGVVSTFDADGRFLRRIGGEQHLNAPWGMAIAPAGFGRFSNRLLVGNFGDGTIQAFDLASGRRVGSLRTAHGKRLAIPVLWGLAFGNGILNQPTDALFFAAGPNFGTGGLYGRISPAAADPTVNADVDE
jgi:uncharacterized protein (TIGR03118 family)